jgi:2-polyprenyl-6-methoxyphenol hydroxylase-like FAD-dependent oxidoreductase
MASQESKNAAENGAKARETGQKIAVVGGSAAGYFAASLLARKGASVRVFERSEALDPLPRTLIVTNHMRHILGAAGESSILN